MFCTCKQASVLGEREYLPGSSVQQTVQVGQQVIIALQLGQPVVGWREGSNQSVSTQPKGRQKPAWKRKASYCLGWPPA